MNKIGDFDYASIMMYPANHRDISLNGRPYLVANTAANQGRMGQRGGLTAEDARKINILYCGGKLTGLLCIYHNNLTAMVNDCTHVSGA